MTLSPRSAFAVFVVCLASGCDTASSPNDLVGTWTIATSTSTLFVTSTIDQELPLFSEAATGSISISGDVSERLSFVDRSRRNQGLSSSSLDLWILARPLADEAVNGVSTRLELQIFRYADSSELTANLVGANSQFVYTSRLTTQDSDVPFKVRGGRLSLASVRLTSGSSQMVTAQGKLVFPTLQLKVGQETALPGATPRLELEGDNIEFRDDGTFYGYLYLLRGTRERFEGTWSADDSGVVTLRSGGDTARFQFDVNGSRLSLTEVEGRSFGPFVFRSENQFLAQPGSFSDSRVVIDYSLQASTP